MPNLVGAKSLTVVIPALNEASGIAKVVADCKTFAQEVIVVDGNSSDGTAEIARQAGATVIIEPRRGYGLAFMRGFLAARTEFIATADGDSTYPVNEIPAILENLIQNDLTFISCSRFPLIDKSSMFFRNQFGNQVISLVGSVLWGRWFKDILSGMWVFRRSALNEMTLCSPAWDFSQEIKLEAHMNFKSRFQERHIHYFERTGHSKLVPWKVGIQNLTYFFIHRFGLRKIVKGGEVSSLISP